MVAIDAVFAPHMATGQVRGEKLPLFVAGDDPEAIKTVMDIGRDIRFDPIDAEGPRNAR